MHFTPLSQAARFLWKLARLRSCGRFLRSSDREAPRRVAVSTVTPGRTGLA